MVKMALETLERIQKEIQKKGTTFRSSVTYKCERCSDTGWIIDAENRCTRCDCSEIASTKNCWVKYGIKPEEAKSLKDYIPYNKLCSAAKQKAIRYIENYSEVSKAENNWYGLFGQAGAGKSHIAIAIGAALLTKENNPPKVVYMPYIEVMRKLKANALDDTSYSKKIEQYQKADVLVIDDLFKDKIKNRKITYELTEADMKHIYPIINYRYYNRKPTIISTECTPNMLLELDEALGGRILERCDENITVFVGEEYNYRLKRFERN